MAWDGGAVLLPPMGDPCARSMSSTWFDGGRGSRRPATSLLERRSQRAVASRGASMRRSVSTTQLRRDVATVPLPPILKAPRPTTFEEMFAAARGRVAKRAALERQGGTSPRLRSAGSLPDFPGGGAPSRGLRPMPEEEPEALLWATTALQSIPGKEDEDSRVGTGAKDEEEQRVDKMVSRARRVTVFSARDSASSRSGSRPETHEGEAPAGGATEAATASAPPGRSGPKFGLSARGSVIVVPPEVDPTLKELLQSIQDRANGLSDGFSEKEVARLHNSFSRFQVPGESDLHADDLCELLRYMGHVLTEKEWVMSILREVTSYDYMDFDEFLKFMEKYYAAEREDFHKKFLEFDADNSGEISVQELRNITKALGFMPFRQMMVEALEVVDNDHNGQLNFEELCTFLAVYRHAEGFTRTEVIELRRQFDRFSIDGGAAANNQKVIPPEDLSDALVQVFGLQVSSITQKMGEMLSSGQGMQKSSLGKGNGEPQYLLFSEFLIIARRVREEELEKCRNEHPEWSGKHVPAAMAANLSMDGGRGLERDRSTFDNLDLDHSGGISEPELRAALSKQGYTPLKKVLNEIFEEVYDGQWGPDSELEFEEFLDFMMVFERRDGFLKSEVHALRKTYERFDEDGSGEVNAMECAALFRHMGYRVTLDDLRDSIAEVDANGSGNLDFREFMRLIRLYREKELARIKSVFDQRKDSFSNLLPSRELQSTLKFLGHDPSTIHTPRGGENPAAMGRGLTFDDLVSLVDAYRVQFVERERKKAGFSDEDLANFRELFNQFDKDRSGEIDAMELQSLLGSLGMEPRSREEQQDLMGKIQLARAAAKEAGVPDDAPEGSPNIQFWSFIQLARVLRSEREKAEEAALLSLQRELRFSEGEVEDFRQVFRMWSKRARDMAGEAADKNQVAANTIPDRISRDTLRRLIRSLGISVSPSNAELLDVQISILDEDGRRETAQLDFMAFLRIMRWMLDTDFAGINGVAAKLA